MDLRCPHRKHAALLKPSADEGLVEFSCSSRWCGKREGVVVRHVFSTKTGQLVSTKHYRQPELKGG
jgi:hypothetical protein